jgi:hypothetical protein
MLTGVVCFFPVSIQSAALPEQEAVTITGLPAKADAAKTRDARFNIVVFMD